MLDFNGYSLAEDSLNEGQQLPEHRLLVSLLNRAILDYLGSQKSERDAAREWFNYEEEYPEVFSYPWVCGHLGINPQYLWRGVERVKQERKENNSANTKRWYLYRGRSEPVAA